MILCSSQYGQAQSDSTDLRQWGFSVNPSSMLGYLGNFTSFNPELPTWQGLGDDQLAIEYLRFIDASTFNRFQLGLFINSLKETKKVHSLNVDGDTLIALFVDEVRQSAKTIFSLRYSKERLIGESRLKGHVGYFSGIGISNESHTFLPQNALENHIGDTIFYEPGRIFQFQTGVLAGVNYRITDNLMISSSIDFGLSIFNQKKETLRQVVFDAIVSDRPYVQNVTGETKTNIWGIDLNYRPNLILTFLF